MAKDTVDRTGLLTFPGGYPGPQWPQSFDIRKYPDLVPHYNIIE